jgi:type II secretory pathway component PulF
MAVFTYKATDSHNEVIGTIAADTPRQARDLLRERGLIVRDLAGYESPSKPAAAKAPSKRASLEFRLPFKSLFRGNLRHHSTSFIRELSTLLSVGVPLLEALETISKQHQGRFQAAVLLLRDRVSAGISLGGAMREQPEVFDELCVNITEVGEDAGTLDTSLERLAEFRERAEQLKGRVSTALIYPIIVSTIAVFASIFLMTFVVPRILEPLVEQGLPLPFPTRVVKGISDFLVTWWWLIALVIFGAVSAFGAFLRSAEGRLRWHRFVLRIPVFGDLVRKQAIVRIAVVLGTLLKSGIVFVRALQIAQRTTTNLVIRDALKRCETAIVAGGEISVALEETKAFPPMVVQIFSLGQQSGRLEEMLDRLATAYDQQVSSAAQRLAAIMEPALIVMLALVVLFIVMATVLPILEAGNAIQ